MEVEAPRTRNRAAAVRRWLVRAFAGTLAAGILGAAVALLVAPDPAYRLKSWMALGRYSSHDPIFAAVGREAGIDPALLKALAWSSSTFHADATHPHGGRGLFLLGGLTARAWAAAHRIESFMPTDLADPETSTRIAAWALQRALERWKATDAPEKLALAEFAEPHRASTTTEASSNDLLAAMGSERRDWVESILRRRAFYKQHGW